MDFDENFLEQMGLASMATDRKQAFLSYLQKELEIRIGRRISEGLSKEQLNEFDNVANTSEATTWLENNRPDYRTIVEKTIEEMKSEISNNKERLLAQA